MPSRSPAEPDAARAERLSPGGGLIVGLVCLLVSFGALASLPRATGGTEPVAIVFPPWIGGAEAVALSFAAGHRVLRSGRLSAIVVVAPTLNGQAPSLPKGAWFSLVLAGLAGCLDIPGRTEASS
jgi:hypothetical protein